MSDLSMFFAQSAVADTTEEVVVSERFKDKDGQPAAWKLRSMTQAESEECRKAATKYGKGKNGVRLPEVDPDEYMAKLAVSSVIFPDLRNAELQKSYGTLGAESLLRHMLLPGEYAVLLEKVQELNGFDKSLDELVDEAKN
ncbi:phage portal protein [Paenibacillus hodogayensis]|uniref:Phage portal protein n=1 Tax=Paenibacillus hodogayensis TaxID=279208 RepID=A0ABV5W0W5_9BACL